MAPRPNATPETTITPCPIHTSFPTLKSPYQPYVDQMKQPLVNDKRTQQKDMLSPNLHDARLIRGIWNFELFTSICQFLVSLDNSKTGH
jgi:hypothetical protein